ncbi:unnamed protein product [Closterium sp. NIES-64]|nr:unnamed protein product [Closterium sp. NIES-64]CAI6008937.1 unnamed protein product [Closterium sp. NIES-65]
MVVGWAESTQTATTMASRRSPPSALSLSLSPAALLVLGLALLGLSWPSIAASSRRVLLQAGGAASDRAAAFGSRVIFNSMQNVGVQDGGAISLTLDRTGGAGFECSDAYSFGMFSVEAKMPAGYSAGVCATYFLQSGSYEQRNEWDFEFLGSPNTSVGMTLQTNAFMGGTGGQEELSAFGFDPAADFHTYSIQWGPDQTVWLVDGEVRRVMGSSNPAYPRDPMRVYFSIWDASTWATGPRTARIPVDYSYAVSLLLCALACALLCALLPCLHSFLHLHLGHWPRPTRMPMYIVLCCATLFSRLWAGCVVGSWLRGMYHEVGTDRSLCVCAVLHAAVCGDVQELQVHRSLTRARCTAV